MTVMSPDRNLDEWELVNGRWVKKSTSDSRPLPDSDIQIGEPFESTASDSTTSDNTSSLGLGTSDVYDDITSGGSSSSSGLSDGGLADALSDPTLGGYGTKYKDAMSGAALVQPTWKMKDLTGLSGSAIQRDINQKMVEAGTGMSPTLLKENYAGAGRSFDAGAARQMAAQLGTAEAQRQAADITTRFGHEMQNYNELLAGQGKMSDETNQLAAWLINRGQSDQDLRFGLQGINASLYASQLATQMAMAGIPLDMISSLLGSLGGLGGGGLLGGVMDPITQALQG